MTSAIARLLAFSALLALGLPRAQASGDAAPGQRPNIIFILADDLGIGDLGCYGQKLIQTPHIDRLARQGLRFLNAYSGSMVCAPSRCALMTGRHMGHATVRNNWEVFPEGQYPLRDSDVTVAQVLQAAGYATGICGKWGLGGPGSNSTPNKKGFDFFFGYNCQRHAHRYYPDYLWRNGERIGLPQSAQRRIYAQDLIAEEGLGFIRAHQDRPFFLFCAWTLPHGPYRTDQVPSLEKYRDTGWSDVQKVYAAMVERLDSDTGRVLTLLHELGIDGNTLVIFASDNGAGGGQENMQRFGSAAGLRAAKGSLYEGGIRVPLIARWPGKVPASRTCDFATAFWDFLPTAAELAGVAPPSGIDGVSIVPALLGTPQTPRGYLYWEQPRGKRLAKAVRLGDWKAYQEDAGKPVELYDLRTDPAEATNVFAAHRDVVARMEQIMAESHTPTELPGKPDPRIWEKYKQDNARLDAMLGIQPAARGNQGQGKDAGRGKSRPAP